MQIFLYVCLRFTEEEYKRLSEALADEGTYNAVAFKYSADYYDPSQPTEEEDANKEHGENLLQVYYSYNKCTHLLFTGSYWLRSDQSS